MKATATAYANIALIKYWGKRPGELNLPARDSLSLTLSALRTVTTVHWNTDATQDSLVLDGRVGSAKETAGVTAFLDRVRQRAGLRLYAEVNSRNEFPTAAGLASSASGYAALAAAATGAAGLALSPAELSQLARLGSGSAARSIFGGLVHLHAGTREDGADCVAGPIQSPMLPELAMVIAVVGGDSPKAFSSRDAMNHCAATSPFYDAWLELVPRDIDVAKQALSACDWQQLGEVVEGNAMAMHAAAIASRQSVLFWRPESLLALACVRALRQQGVGAWATMDAGPHVKVLTHRADAERVRAALTAVPGVTSAVVALPGPAVEVRFA